MCYGRAFNRCATFDGLVHHEIRKNSALSRMAPAKVLLASILFNWLRILSGSKVKVALRFLFADNNKNQILYGFGRE